MNIFSKIFGAMGYIPKSSIHTSDAGWHPLIDPSFRTASGITINEKTAMTISAVWACVKIISETIGSLPLILFEQLPNGDKERAIKHPLYNILKFSPNQWQTAIEFWEMMGGHLALRGNAFAKIERGFGGVIKSLIPLNPDKVIIRRLKNGRLRYDWIIPFQHGLSTDEKAGTIEQIPQEDMFHLRGLSSDGVVGISPISANRDTLGLAKAAERYGAKFFGDNGSVGSVLEHPAKISKESQIKLRDSVKAQNEKGILILEEGMKWQQLGIKPEEAQFLGTRQFQVVDVARIYRMPPHMIQDLSKSSFNNIEQQAKEFVQYTMMPYFVRIQQKVHKELLFGDTQFFAEFLFNALLRGDFKNRTNGYAKAIQWGWMNRNEVRRLENMNKAPGLDDYLYPANLLIVGAPIQTAEPGGFGANPLGVLVKDAATRIAQAESRTFTKHNNKEGRWGVLFKKKHQGYITKTLKPIYESYEKASGDKLDYEKTAEAIVNTLVWGSISRIETITKIVNTSFILEVTKNVEAK